MSIMLNYHEFTEEIPAPIDPEVKFIAYCGQREKPVMATFDIENGMFYTLGGKMIMGVTLWFQIPPANRLWANLGKNL